jgi:flavin reductase (DIM6/NTAB) family NADH-FMN oxidoreductase RutF
MSAEDFKKAFRQLAAGVSVVTFRRGGRLHGFTATSVASVSMNPPLALFCVARENQSYPHLDVGTPVGFSILSAARRDLSERFAAKAGAEGYDDVELVNRASRVPLLAGAIGHIEGAVAMLIPAGDHVIVLCDLAAARSAPSGFPLLYWQRGYHALAPLSALTEVPEAAGAEV